MRRTVFIAILSLFLASALFAQSDVVIGKVQQQKSTFTIYDTNGKKVGGNVSLPNRDLVGWGKDFYVVRLKTTFDFYNSKNQKTKSITVGGATTASVANDLLTVKVGTSTFKYDKTGKKK
jgi:serine protease inhibitor ecotin